MLIEFNKKSSKLSTNTYSIVRRSTSFTFGYPNLMLSLLQYISFYFNINIATFVGFQIAKYAYAVLRTQAQVARVNA